MNRDAEIFAEAIELPEAERAAFVERACGDDHQLRQRVELLLAGYDAAGMFMENAPVSRPAAAPEDMAGTAIGPYSLVRKIGEGGCGVVYLADQHAPVRRQVALKVIKPGMDTRSVIARFEAERQALAMMDHPDIARVFDAGATEEGRPYFVMELVDGVPITKFCDEQSLGVEARLELFARVCVALQHAHQKGVIHRDLKPSNILVALRDGVPAPKIIDFGIAKATQGRLSEHTLLTGLDQFIGTPAYMSPEQAERRDLDIDTRSDVYSLGVLLYELLTGRPPYDAKALVRAGVDEIRRIIREVDPPRPSTRVSTLGDADLATVARLRGAAPTQLRSVLRGDLDWIVMHCLEKERGRRYGTAVELAEDVRRHLRQEPVTARPPDTLYRVQRFIARNRVACASTALVAVALIAATIVSVRQAMLTARAEAIAQDERDAARRQREQAEALVAFMLGDYRNEVKKLGQTELLDRVSERATRYFASLDLRQLSDTALTQQAKLLTQIGETRIQQARYAEAGTLFQDGYRRAAALAARHPRNADMLFERAQAEYWIGFVARRRGDFATCRTWFARYHDSARALLALEGGTYRAQRELIAGQHNLAVVDFDRGSVAEAQRGFLAERDAVTALVAAHPADTQLRYRLADIASWLSRIAEAEGRYADALAQCREMSTRLEELVAQEPTAHWKYRLATSHTFTAYGLLALGRHAEAAALFERNQATFDAMVASDPKNQQWQLSALNARVHQATLLVASGQAGAAAALLTEARERLEALVAAEPAARVFTSRLAAAWTIEGRLRQALVRADALAAAERAVALTEQLVQEDRADTWALWEFAQAALLAGRLEQARGQTGAARRRWERVLTVLAARAENSNDWRVLDPVAQACVLTDQPARARPFIERLQRFGYRPIDPSATSILGVAL